MVGDCIRYVACAVVASTAQRFTFGIVGCLECGVLEDPDASALLEEAKPPFLAVDAPVYAGVYNCI